VTTPHDPATERFDVGVIGDGPAGSALAQACRRLAIDVVLVGDDAPWTATYSTWVDDLVDDSGVELVDADAVVAIASDPVTASASAARTGVNVIDVMDCSRGLDGPAVVCLSSGTGSNVRRLGRQAP
jgi:threonine dehydrogenase-like Zn-dependent dehydrogenase